MEEGFEISNLRIVNLETGKSATIKPTETFDVMHGYVTKVAWNEPIGEITLGRKEIKKLKRVLGLDKKYLKYLKRVSNRTKLYGK